MSKKEVVVKETNAVATHEIDSDILDLMPRAESNDFEITRLTLVQPTSKIDGNPGDIIDSSTKEAVGKMGQAFLFVPIFFAKDLTITDKATGKWKRNELKTSANAHLTTFENRFGKDADGTEVERKERLNLFLIKEADLDSDFPRVYRMIIKPSSFKEAKKFISEWDIQIRCKQAPYLRVWQVTPRQIANEKGKYVVYDFAKVMDGKTQKVITGQQSHGVVHWVKTLLAKKDAALKDDHADDEGEIEKTVQTHNF